MKRLITLLVAITFTLLLLQNDVRGAESSPIYQSPRPGSQLIQPESTIVFRFKEDVDRDSLARARLQVDGSSSGRHEGDMVLARDNRTVIFSPTEPFTPGERVNVNLVRGFWSTGGHPLTLEDFKFTITPKIVARTTPPVSLFSGTFPRSISRTNDGLLVPDRKRDNYVTLPGNLPEITISSPASGTDDGFIFFSNFDVDWSDRSVWRAEPYLLIVDDEGDPVFYRAMRPGLPTLDFKKQPNGLLTYGEWAGKFYGMNSSYEVVKSYEAGNGYTIDIHDLQVIDDDHALFMIYDTQQLDMTAYGGLPDARVVGLVIQEIDADGNVVFQWRSWDYFEFEESAADLTEANIDYVHGNSIELDGDGNILISSRNMNEVTKINRENGEIIWRLGGKANEFDFINDPDLFFAQHDARRLANGNITIFDNHVTDGSTFARAVEYKLDEESEPKTATKVWEHRSDAMSGAMGNVQRLPNGNTMIGWGTYYPTLNEVKPNGEVALELTFTPPEDPNLLRNTYRAFRFEWEGNPTTKPLLVARNEMPGITTLYTSWNGATNVSAYRVYGGESADNMTALQTAEKEGFETMIMIADADEQYCYLQVMPLDENGAETRLSNLALAEHCIRGRVFLPIHVIEKENDQSD